MLWNDEREPTIKHCMGRQIDVIQKFTRIHCCGQNWWWANGIRVEYLLRIHHIAALHQSPRVLVKNERKAWIFFRTDYFHVDVQRHLMEISRQWTGMRIKHSTRFDSSKKIFTKKMVIPSDLDQKRRGIPLMTANHKEIGTVLQSWWCWNSSKSNIQSSLQIHRSIVSRGAQKRRWWKILNTLLRWWRNDWNCFSHNYFCLSTQYQRSSLRFVWWIQGLSSKNGETRAGRTIWPILERVERLSQQDRVVKTCTDAGFLKTVEVGQYFMTKHTDEF